MTVYGIYNVEKSFKMVKALQNQSLLDIGEYYGDGIEFWIIEFDFVVS